MKFGRWKIISTLTNCFMDDDNKDITCWYSFEVLDFNCNGFGFSGIYLYMTSIGLDLFKNISKCLMIERKPTVTNNVWRAQVIDAIFNAMSSHFQHIKTYTKNSILSLLIKFSAVKKINCLQKMLSEENSCQDNFQKKKANVSLKEGWTKASAKHLSKGYTSLILYLQESKR